MPSAVSERDSQPLRKGSALRWILIACLTLSLIYGIAVTAQWPLVGDAPLLHYVAFSIDHGRTPYRDIIEVDMPGTYALEWACIHLLGPGSAAWRVFDFGLCAAILAALTAITWEDDWLQGFFAGSLFALLHFRDGPTHTGQRDLMMTVMAVISVAFLFHAVRRQRVWAAAAFGLFAGAAATIKPSGQLFGTVLFFLLWWRLRRRKLPTIHYLSAATAGFAIPVLACVSYLVDHNAFTAFLHVTKTIGAYHASLGRPPLLTLIVGSFPSVLLAVAIPALPLFVMQKPWKQWQTIAILACIVIGALSYIIQGKGFPYHRYPIEAFLLLLCAQVLFTALRNTGWQRIVAICGLLAGALYLAPASAVIAKQYDAHDQEFQQLLTADLTALGGPTLNNQVQCFEMAAECHNTLYNMNLLEATGFMYDCYMFQPAQTPVSLQYRADFWAAIHANPPQVYIETDQQCFTTVRDFSKTARWPEFQQLLDTEYTLTTQRTPPHLLGWWRHPAVPFSYRLYVRKPEADETPVTAPTPTRNRFRAPATIFWVALALRVACILIGHTYRIRIDQQHFNFGFEMGRIARSLVEGHGYANPFNGTSGPTAWTPPLYPLLIALSFKLFGIYTNAAALFLLLCNSIFSAAIAPAIYEIAARCLDATGLARRNSRHANPVALWSAWLWAAYPAALQYAIHWLWEMSLSTCLFTWTLVFALRLRSIGESEHTTPPKQCAGQPSASSGAYSPSPTPRSSHASPPPSSGSSGRSCVHRTKLSVPSRARSSPPSSSRATLAPWIIRNERVFHAFIPTRSNLGIELYESLLPEHDGFPWGTTLPLWPGDPEFQTYVRMGEIPFAHMRATQAKAMLRAHPATFAHWTLDRFLFFWDNVPHPADKHPAQEFLRNLSYGFLSVCGLLGLALMLTRRVPAAGLFALTFLLVPLPYYVITVQPRFRHPIEPLIAILAVYLFRSTEPRKEQVLGSR